jgi:hypothetical protein
MEDRDIDVAGRHDDDRISRRKRVVDHAAIAAAAQQVAADQPAQRREGCALAPAFSAA